MEWGRPTLTRQPGFVPVAVPSGCACVPASVWSEFGDISCFILGIQEFCIQLPSLSGFVLLEKGVCLVLSSE